LKGGAELGATGAAFARYRTSILPTVRDELDHWAVGAASIPDPTLRAAAVDSIREKSNPEATAVFAILAPRRHRRRVIAGSVALQVAIDFLDVLGETPGDDPLAEGRRAHEVLAFALTPGAEADLWLGPGRDDGGYLEALGRRCQDAVAGLPGAGVLPTARIAAVRCGDGQSHTHAAAVGGDSGALEAWAGSLPGGADHLWWEVAAGASSSVAAHALIAIAAHPGAGAAEASAVDRAYQPAVGALTVLLDDLVDQAADAAAGEHSYLAHSADPGKLIERLEAMTVAARASLGGLPTPRAHLAILAGVLAWYLADPEAERQLGAPGVRRLLAAAGPATAPLTRMIRWTR
jgi:tetraprenyl-beta-curcumene synthase